MEFIFELIGEGILELLFETSANKKVTKWIRYPLVFIFGVFYSMILICFCLLAIDLVKEKEPTAILMIFIILMMVTMTISTFYRRWRKKNNFNTHKNMS